MKVSMIVVLGASLLIVPGCGSDFEPLQRETTGLPAAPLGQVVDVDVSLPNLLILSDNTRGLELALRLEVDGAGPGRHDTRYAFEGARVGLHSTTVEDLSDGKTTLNVSSNGSWTTGRIGPLRVEGTVFEMALDGDTPDGGWTVEGRSWESQSGLLATFRGWRRDRFLVTTTDFAAAGRLVEVSLRRGSELYVRRNLVGVSTDPVVRRSGRSVYVVNRLAFDNLQRLDPEAGFATSWQAGMGVGSNPHDVLQWSDDKLYVTRYEPPFNDVAVVSPRGGTIVANVPLGPLAENRDAAPRADRMAVAEGLVFVGLQDIDRTFTRYGEAKLAAIDPERDEVVGVVGLGGKNPGTVVSLKTDDGRTRLYVALAGIFPGLLAQDLSGGVVVVDPVTLVVERWALDDDDAGGNVAGLALGSQRLGYVVVSDATYRNRVVAFDPRTGEVLRTVWESGDLVPEIEVSSRGILAIPDNSFARPRLCLYQIPAVSAEAESPLGCAELDLGPFSIEVLD